MKRIGIAAAVAVILVVGLPTLAVPQVMAQTPPSPVVDVGGSVQGYVLSDLGGPIAGASIVASSNASGGEPQTVFSDQEGFYALKLGAGTWRLNVTARAHDGKADNVVALAGGVPVQKNFTLDHNGWVLRGKVADAKTGAALAGVTVEAHPSSAYRCAPGEPCPLAAESGMAMPEFYRMPYTTRTGADGSYALAIDKNEAGFVSVRAWKENYRDGYAELEVKADATQDLRLEPIPPKTAVLEGRVVDAKTGAPIADAWVSAWPSYDEVRAMEGEAASGGGTSGSAGSTEPAAPDRVAPSPAVYPCCQFEGNNTSTDRDGRFRMGMHPGTYQFSVGAPEHGQHAAKVTLADGETKTMDVRLEPIPGDTVIVRGTVVDQSTGKPVAGAWVSVENQQWGAYNGGQADAQGRFEVKTKPGWTMVWVRVDGGGYDATPVAAQADAPASSSDGATGSDEAIRAPDAKPYIQPQGSFYPWVRSASFAENQEVDWRVELQPKPKAELKLQGYILDAKTKEPITNAYVNIHNEDTGDWGWGQTDQYGSFVFQVRPGTHSIHANAEGHFQNAVVVAVREAVTRVDLTLEPGQPSGYCCIAYARGEAAAMDDKGTAMGAPAGTPPPSPAAAPGSAGGPGGDAQSAEASAASRNSQLAGSGTATYGATGESLGPYDPSKAPAPGTPQTGGAAVPGPAPLLVLAGLGAAAVVLARRRK